MHEKYFLAQSPWMKIASSQVKIDHYLNELTMAIVTSNHFFFWINSFLFDIFSEENKTTILHIKKRREYNERNAFRIRMTSGNFFHLKQDSWNSLQMCMHVCVCALSMCKKNWCEKQISARRKYSTWSFCITNIKKKCKRKEE